LKDINYCRIYQHALFISDITTLECNTIEEWAGRVQKQAGRQSTWEWPIQQGPIAWKAWKTALEYLAPDGHISNNLGEWRSQHHHIMECYLDASTCTPYHQVEGVWTYHNAGNIGRLIFQVKAHACDASTQYTHVVEVCERTRYMEIANKYKINETHIDVIEHVIEYTSGIGDTFNSLQDICKN
jgi:hypothetical protein